MKNYIAIQNFPELENYLKNSEKVLIFKHSTRCPISSDALSEYNNFLQTDPNLVCTYIDVIESRSVSNQVESYFNIRHESPQVILVKNNQATWNASHRKITKDALVEALKNSA